MSKIRYAVLAPLVRALLAPVLTRPAPATVADPWFAELAHAAGPEDEDDAPPTQRRAA